MKILLLVLVISSTLSFCHDTDLPEPDLRIALWPNHPLPENPNEHIKRKKDNTLLIDKVKSPSLEVFHSSSKDYPGMAIMVLPGGGYSTLAYNIEGVEIAQWLVANGVTAFVLRYSIGQSRRAALRDAQRAMGIIRNNADKWKVDSKNIGVLGFSAGGHLAARLSTNWRTRGYPAVDDSDLRSMRPDFAALIYPAYLSKRSKVHLLPGTVPDSATPPVFIAHAVDDEKYVNGSRAFYQALMEVNASAELHLFENGGHGFGIRKSGADSDQWTEIFLKWIRNQL